MKKIFIIATSVSLLTVFSCKRQHVVEMIRPVRYTTVSMQNSSEERTFSGTAESETSVNLSFRHPGILTKLDIVLGQKVKKGELLARLDNVQEQLALESAQEQLNSAKSQMNTAKLNLDRIRNLYEKGTSSLSDYENAKNAYRTTSAACESAKRSVQLQKEQVGYGFIYAPENGYISAVNVDLDENISAGQVIGVLDAGTSIKISIGMPESMINKVKQQMNVNVSLSSVDDKIYHGQVTEISPAVDPLTSTYPVTVLLQDADTQIKSGMAANVIFNFADSTETQKVNMLTIPQQSVGEDGKGRFVFVIESKSDTGVVAKRYIEIGDLTNNGFQVVKGINEGDKIATAGLQTLLDGQKVLLTNDENEK